MLENSIDASCGILVRLRVCDAVFKPVERMVTPENLLTVWTPKSLHSQELYRKNT